MKPKVFIDGCEGTTGLKIYERLRGRDDIELLEIDPSLRKDTAMRKEILNDADIVFLCLPDQAARDTVPLIHNSKTKIIDPSTAHRVSDGWVYGLPELSGKHKEAIGKSSRTANPGCHATGVLLLLAPLIKAGTLNPADAITITSLTGYTGGGKAMINEYEQSDRKYLPGLNAPRLYAVTSRHKHIPEIMKYLQLEKEPVFLPVVADYPQGMQVIIPLNLPDKRREVYSALSQHYSSCRNIDVSDTSPLLAPANVNAGSDRVTLKVLGFDDTIILTAQFDNLGKGASGAAVQNMNIMLGFDEYEGLVL